MRIYTTVVLALAVAAMAAPAQGQAFADLKSALVDYSKSDVAQGYASEIQSLYAALASMPEEKDKAKAKGLYYSHDSRLTSHVSRLATHVSRLTKVLTPSMQILSCNKINNYRTS